ncbi:unnamed protein product [Ambrosiozyma monospora]|uniref:Unnamed protein product n=1 Tax=Ambrosiozyma monospora TaxID=43982 RepID=A0ACB5T0V0_AMBMO|nr:unnamed protein product [Ambrosiozyma monospora]
MLSARTLRTAARSALKANIVRTLPRLARPSLVAARSYASAKAAPTEVSSILESKIRGVSEEANLDETGRVLSVGYVLHPIIPSTLFKFQFNIITIGFKRFIRTSSANPTPDFFDIRKN